MNKTGLLFPGSGVHYVGMGKKIYKEYQVARDVFDQADDLLSLPLSSLCFGTNFQKLSKYDQLAIYVHSFACYQVLKEHMQLEVSFMAGHSLGEYTALTCAGYISFVDGLKLIKERNKLMWSSAQERKCGMLSINRIKEDQLKSVCEELNKLGHNVYISIINSPNHFLVSGALEGLSLLQSKIKSENAEIINLPVETPSHSILMNDVSLKFYDYLKDTQFNSTTINVISNMTARPYEDNSNMSNLLVEHMVNPLLWKQSMEYILSQGVNSFIEVGPQSVLKNLIKFISPTSKAYSLDVKSDVDFLMKLSSNPVDLKLLNNILGIIVSSPNKLYNNARYKDEVILPYRKIESIRNKLLTGERVDQITYDELNFILMQVLKAKGLTKEELDIVESDFNI